MKIIMKTTWNMMSENNENQVKILKKLNENFEKIKKKISLAIIKVHEFIGPKLGTPVIRRIIKRIWQLRGWH